MRKSAASTAPQAFSTAMPSSFTNFLKQFQQMFSFACCRDDFSCTSDTRDDNWSRDEEIIDSSSFKNRSHYSSQFYSSYPNFASFVVESQDFHGRVMAPFDLPPDVSEYDEPVTRKTKRCGKGDRRNISRK